MATRIVTGRLLGLEALDALGISSENVTSVSITMTPDSAAEIHVIRAMSEHEAGKLVEHLKKYQLVDAEQ